MCSRTFDRTATSTGSAGLYSTVVLDRAEVDSDIRVLVDLQQLPHRPPAVGLRADRAQPETKERSPEAVWKEHAERAERHAPTEAAGDPPDRPARTRHER